MSVLVYSLGLVFIAFLMHLFLWKIYLPRNQTTVLMYIFFGTLITGVIVLWKFSTSLTVFGVSAPQAVWEYLQISFLFVSLTLSYISTYSAIAADSPSLVMIMNITKAGVDGLDREKLFAAMTDDLLVKPRIRDLVNARMVYLDGDKYKIAAKSILLIRILILYRKLLGIPKGG